ncbi:MAG: 2OG-Fe(II) oxygenase, partial [Gemmatimonadetes bacterium]|nr:2OG-Fe(II) oxygenase [Gemmatimonadota bacterium]
NLELLVGGSVVATRGKGQAFLFPSYIGHRVTPVTRGIRRSLVTWCVGPAFR